MQMDGSTLPHRTWHVGQQPDLRIEARGRGMDVWMQHPVAARHGILGQAWPGDVQRHTLTGERFGGWPVLRVQPAHPQFQAGR